MIEPAVILKSINRHIRKKRLQRDAGWPDYGWDYITWRITWPHLAQVYLEAARKLTGRPNGLFTPRGVDFYRR